MTVTCYVTSEHNVVVLFWFSETTFKCLRKWMVSNKGICYWPSQKVIPSVLCTLASERQPLVITFFSNSKGTTCRLVLSYQILRPDDLLVFLTTTNFWWWFYSIWCKLSQEMQLPSHSICKREGLRFIHHAFSSSSMVLTLLLPRRISNDL